MILTRDLEDCRERFGKGIDAASNAFGNLEQEINGKRAANITMMLNLRNKRKTRTDMLVNKNYSNIFPFLGEIFKGAFNGRGFGLVINNEKVALRVGRIGNVL